MCCWLQSVTSLLLVLLTGATLAVLYGYAKDTKRIANDSSTQVERSQMPFLIVVMREGDQNVRSGWILENQGFGPALNVTFSDYREGERHMRPIPPLGVGAKRNSLHNQIDNALAQTQGFEAEYESLSGKRYRTTVIRGDGGALETKFHKP